MGNLSIPNSALNMAKGGELSEDAYRGESGNVDCGSLTLATRARSALHRDLTQSEKQVMLVYERAGKSGN